MDCSRRQAVVAAGRCQLKLAAKVCAEECLPGARYVKPVPELIENLACLASGRFFLDGQGIPHRKPLMHWTHPMGCFSRGLLIRGVHSCVDNSARIMCSYLGPDRHVLVGLDLILQSMPKLACAGRAQLDVDVECMGKLHDAC